MKTTIFASTVLRDILTKKVVEIITLNETEVRQHFKIFKIAPQKATIF
jgi:hypothetical protein